MFEPTESANVFGIAPGEDFPRILFEGLKDRLVGQPPEAIAKVLLFVNTRRMQRRLRAMFEAESGLFLPKIRLITELAKDHRFADIPPPVPKLRRRLELSQLVAALLKKDHRFAPRSSLYDLSDSLADLLDEMQGEGIEPKTLRDLELDLDDVSDHWQRTLSFVNLVEPYFADDVPGQEARQRMVVERLMQAWDKEPPSHPIIVAGSTGSRGTTALFMNAVAKLPQGALVLPGFDFDMPLSAWHKLDKALHGEDHPQFRFAKLVASLDQKPTDVYHWLTEKPAESSRTRLISLALRPAPVTDQWLTEGKDLTDIRGATESITLLEAHSPRAEATAIALILRQAAETGETAALISPDRVLTRQVTAALDRWGIIPDDSAGQPLHLSPPGRLLRQVVALFGRKLTADVLLALLKHPLVATGSDRGQHLLNTRELELWLRRRGMAYVLFKDLLPWAEDNEDRLGWLEWLKDTLVDATDAPETALGSHIQHHLTCSEAMCAGPKATGSGELWEKEAGKEAKRIFDELTNEAEHGGTLSVGEYSALFESVLSTGEAREPITAHPKIMIWGNLEARVQGADLVILGGLNEGSWPKPPRPDPWLNRVLRDRAGLLLPEREIGLAAHDFQQAACAKKVVLSRAIRDAEAQTVPSRWLNRLVNLMGGLDKDGPEALQAMRDRGQFWMSIATELDAPTQNTAPALRPAPRPPVEARPKQISITEVKTLIRDPYAVYARRILGLQKLDPLHKEPDAPLRGIVFHMIFEAFVARHLSGDLETDTRQLLEDAGSILSTHAGWLATQQLWRARIARLAHWFIKGEYERRKVGTVTALETKAKLDIESLGITLGGKIDRVDKFDDGTLAIYDYKTGIVPSKKQQTHFDKQLLLSAMIAKLGKMEGALPGPVSEVAYIGLGTKHQFDPKPMSSDEIDGGFLDLQRLLAAYQSPQKGYASRRAIDANDPAGNFDHLARFGEWNQSADPNPEEVG